MSEPAKQSRPVASVGAIVGAGGGYTLSQYCGASIWIPGAAIILFMLLFTKSPVRPLWFAGAIAVTAAHIAWFVVASAIAGIWAAAALDIVILTLGVICLWWRPGLPAVLFLGFVQCSSLALNAYMISSMEFGEASHRALTTHCALRLLSIICLIVGYSRLRRERLAPPPLPAALAS